MDYFILARVLHVLGVVLWIGGVAMVTMVLMPVIRRMESESTHDGVEFFERVERRFAWQARGTTLLTGLSGFYMLHLMDGWGRYQILPGYWWLHAMTAVWVIFTLVLFILEPLVLHRLALKYLQRSPQKTFAVIHSFHWVLLTVSLITVAGAVAGSHGWFPG